jgi:class 3 adenylate cyclase/tetratricopeptide (TPR) repeat protein
MTTAREERRLVTAMFVDVVGSTELVTRMGAERMKRELGNAFGEIATLITSHGGTVEKYIGDAVYALFGAPVAHEDDPLRALRAAEALREWCAAGAAGGHPFAVRVGIETGEAVVDLEAAATTKQQMSVGPVVNIAARLQQRADPGEILVGPTAREATEASADLESVGDVDLKGLGSVPVWRLVRTGVVRDRALPFVGRDAELGLLEHAYQRAAKGRSVLAVVSGPPGQGKTRLVQEFLRGHRVGSRVVTTRCRPADEVGVFAPVREILGVTTLDALADQIGRMCSDDIECERVVAGLAESAGIAAARSLSSLPAAEREDEIVQAWRRYVALLGGSEVLVLAVDDIHWADPSLVRLVDRITFGGPRVLVVATARPEFAEAAGIRPSGDRFFIELEGLDRDEAKQLAELAGRDDDRVVDRAEGNPLFLVELARGGTGGELPLTLQGALGARLDQMAPADRALLSLAAIAGDRFTAGDAAFLGQRDLVDVGRTLTRLVDLHFLDLGQAGYRFHHGLVRDVAYGRLLTAERMKAHARFARGRVHPEDAESLAHHWWEALRPPDGEWVWGADPDLAAMRHEGFAALQAAAQRHADHFAVDAAIELVERAAVLASNERERAEAELLLGTTYRRVLRQDDAWVHQTRALDLFRANGSVPLGVYHDLLRTAAYFGAFRTPPAHERITEIAAEGAAAARAAGDQGALARILRAQAQYLINRFNEEPERAGPVIDAAVAAAEASGDAQARRTTLITKTSVLRIEGSPLDLAVFREIEALLGDADALERMDFLRMRAQSEFLAGDLAASERSVIESVALADPMGPHNRTHAWAHAATLFQAQGRWKELIELAHRTERLVKENATSAFCTSAGLILAGGATAHALRGERDDALGLLRSIPAGDIEPDLIAMVPRALLGIASPASDRKLREKRWAWWEWGSAAMRAVVLGRPDDAEAAVRRMGPITVNSNVQRAFAEAVGEAIAGMRGGPTPTYAALRQLGLMGWIEILKRRVDAEY